MAQIQVATVENVAQLVIQNAVEPRGYETRALLYADLVPEDGTIRYVTNDSTSAYNGTYRKVGATTTGSWVQTSYDRIAIATGLAEAHEVILSDSFELVAPTTFQQSIPEPASTSSNTSTFTGWGGPVGVRSPFNRVRLYVRSWDESDPVTSVRVVVTEDTHDGAELVDVTESVTVPHDVDTLVEIDLGETVDSEENLFVMFRTDGKTGRKGATNANAYPIAEGYPAARWTASTDIESGSSNELAANVNLWFGFVFEDTDSTYPAPTPELLERIGIPSLDARATALETDAAQVYDVDHPVTDTYHSIGSASWTSESSTFTGWGSPIGHPQNIDAISFRVKPWDGTSPITQVRILIWEDDINGTLLLDEIVDVEVATGEDKLIRHVLSERLENAGDEQLFAFLRADGKMGRYGSSQIADGPYPYSPDGPFPKGRYTTNGLAGGSLGGSEATFGGLVWIRTETLDRDTEVATPTAGFTSEVGAALLADPAFTESLGIVQTTDHLNRHLLRDWQAQLGKIRYLPSGSDQAVIALFGDSWLQGAARLPRPLSRMLKAEYGDAGAGFASFSNSHGAADSADVTVSRSGTWADSDAQSTSRGVDIGHASSSEVGAKITVNILDSATGAVIHWYRQSGGGEFRWRVDGGGWTSVDTDGAAGFQSTAITGWADTTHTLEVEIETAGSGVILMGADIRRSGAGVRLHKLGNGGLTTNGAIAVDATVWQDGLAALAPNVVCVLLGTNDMSNNVALETYQARIVTLVGRIRTARPLCDVLLIAPSDNGLEGRTYSMQEYSAALRQTAIDNGCAFLDLWGNVGPYADAYARGLMEADTVHPTTEAGRMFAALLFNRLLKVD